MSLHLTPGATEEDSVYLIRGCSLFDNSLTHIYAKEVNKAPIIAILKDIIIIIGLSFISEGCLSNKFKLNPFGLSGIFLGFDYPRFN